MEWVKVPDHFCEVTFDGDVRSTLNPRAEKLKPIKRDKWRSVSVVSEIDGKRRMIYVHKLVALAFHGERPKGMEIRHLDGNGSNNRADNLSYGTKTQNMRDKFQHGTMPLGHHNVNSKLSKEDVEWLRSLDIKWTYQKYADAGECLGVNMFTIQDCILGVSYRYDKLGEAA